MSLKMFLRARCGETHEVGEGDFLILRILVYNSLYLLKRVLEAVICCILLSSELAHPTDLSMSSNNYVPAKILVGFLGV